MPSEWQSSGGCRYRAPPLGAQRGTKPDNGLAVSLGYWLFVNDPGINILRMRDAMGHWIDRKVGQVIDRRIDHF